MNITMSILLLIVGLINFAPLMGIVSEAALVKLYGVNITDSNLLILMRHRALLFGIVGGFIIVSIWLPHYQPAAFVMGFVSMIGYIVLVYTGGEYNDLLKRVVMIDWVAIVLFTIALILKIKQ